MKETQRMGKPPGRGVPGEILSIYGVVQEKVQVMEVHSVSAERYMEEKACVYPSGNSSQVERLK